MDSLDSQRGRYFTPKEAIAALPEAQAELEVAVQMLRQGRALLAGAEGQEGELSEEDRARIEGLEGQINQRIARLSRLGIDVKGLNPGLLDFPALRYGQKVYLCWREGESTITHWHPLEGGFAARQPLEDTEEGAWEWCN